MGSEKVSIKTAAYQQGMVCAQFRFRNNLAHRHAHRSSLTAAADQNWRATGCTAPGIDKSPGDPHSTRSFESWNAGAVLLANSAQALKRARQAEIHRQRNASQRSNMRTAIKKVIAAIAAGDRDKARLAYDAAVPVIDRVAGKGLIHANKAARHKSRLNQHIRSL